MAIAKFNSSFKPLRGKVGGLVFKHYADKVVVTRAPTFTGQWSTAQQAGRKRFALASAYARTVCAEPLLRAKYEKIAAHRGLTVRSVAISAYLRGKTAEIETPSRPVRRPRLSRAKPRQPSTLFYRSNNRRSHHKPGEAIRSTSRGSSDLLSTTENSKPSRSPPLKQCQNFTPMKPQPIADKASPLLACKLGVA
jgi:hypothetical protein